MRTIEDVERLFSYHRLDSDGVMRVHHFRKKFKELAADILNGVPETPERTLVLRELHSTMMKLNVCISLDYPVDPTG